MRCYIVDSVIGDFEQKEHTYVLPVLIQIGEESYVDDQTFDKNIISIGLDEKKKITTSQPNLGETLKLFENLKKNYTEFVLIHTSSKISGTFATSQSAAEQSELNYIAIDSRGVGPHMELLLDISMENEQMKLPDLETKLNRQASTAGAVIITNSLERLHLSGRINILQMLMSDLLKITPVFLLENGELKVLKKERSQKKAIKTMLDYVESIENKKRVTILEYEFDDTDVLKERLNKTETKELHASLLIHFGKGAIGVLWN
jgi:DegV family protein with EDD domain